MALDPSEEKQNQDDDKHKTDSSTEIGATAVKWTAPKASKATEEQHN
jgi:hypothetical protein